MLFIPPASCQLESCHYFFYLSLFLLGFVFSDFYWYTTEIFSQFPKCTHTPPILFVSSWCFLAVLSIFCFCFFAETFSFAHLAYCNCILFVSYNI